MKSTLLLGDHCVNNIEKVYNSYVETYRTIAWSKLKLPKPMYTPFYRYSNFFESELTEKIEQVCELGIENTNDFEKNLLRKYIFDELNMRKDFFPEGDIVEIPDYPPTSEEVDELNEAISILKKSSSWISKLFDMIILDVWLVSQNGSRRFIGGGSSFNECIGIILMSLRPNGPHAKAELAIALAHDLGHNVCYLYQTGQNVIDNASWNTWVYSPLRKIERPSYAAFHAAIALGYMISMAIGIRDLSTSNDSLKDHLNSKILTYKNDLSVGLNSLEQLHLTDIGKVMIKELKSLNS